MGIFQDAIVALKYKTIEDYKRLVNRLERGHKDSYEQILEQIAYINYNQELQDIVTYQQFMNNTI